MTRDGVSKPYAEAGMYLVVSSTRAAQPVIAQQPQSVTVKAGTEVGFTVLADGIGVGYQWQRDGVDVASPSGLAGEATAASLRLSNVTAADSGLYTVIVSNPSGSVTSTPARLTVTP